MTQQHRSQPWQQRLQLPPPEPESPVITHMLEALGVCPDCGSTFQPRGALSMSVQTRIMWHRVHAHGMEPPDTSPLPEQLQTRPWPL